MNERKLNQLFSAAGSETPVAPSEGFAFLVMQQIQRNPARAELSVSDVLGMWFPRLAVVAAAVIAICVISEVVFSSNAPSLSESAAQLSDPLVAEN
jgi:hypothetical protein